MTLELLRVAKEVHYGDAIERIWNLGRAYVGGNVVRDWGGFAAYAKQRSDVVHRFQGEYCEFLSFVNRDLLIRLGEIDKEASDFGFKVKFLLNSISGFG